MKNMNILEEMIFANAYSNKYFDAVVWYGKETASELAIDFAVNAVLEFRKLDLKSANEDLEQHHVEG